MAKRTVYHGGYTPVENPEICVGRNTKDFGVGFYCTIIKEQAQRWARRYDAKIVSIYDVRLNQDLNIIDFLQPVFTKPVYNISSLIFCFSCNITNQTTYKK